MKLKKFFALALAAATLALALTACGSKADDSADNSDANTDNQAGETVTVKLGVVGGIYDDLWASAKAALADEGIDLEIVQFSDYVTPNNALANGDIDLNAFQHRIYLQNEIDNYGYAIQNIGNTFIIPLNLYSQKVSSVDELKDGDVVAIPDDLTNGGRALKVLEAAGLIELDPNAAFTPTVDHPLRPARRGRRGRERQLRARLWPQDRRGHLQGQRPRRGGVLESDRRAHR